jgi:hypothetical protein
MTSQPLTRTSLKTRKARGCCETVGTAMTMYREMGMTHWLEQAEAKMKEFG